MFRVPPDLQQRLSKPSDEALNFDTYLGDAKDDDGISTFLSDCGGCFKDLVAVVRRNKVCIFDVFTRNFVCSYKVKEDEEIKCVAYHHLLRPDKEEGHPGLLLGINTNNRDEPNYVAVLALAMDKVSYAKLLRKIAIKGRIQTIRTLISSYHMRDMAPYLHPRMAEYPNVIAVGTSTAQCYLFHLHCNDTSGYEDANEVVTAKMSDALKSFVNKDLFLFSTPGQRTIKINVSDVSVTSIGFVDRARAVLVGLSFGGIVAVSLSDNPSIECLPIASVGSPVRHIEAMVPENDPRPRLYFWASFDCSESSAASMTMYIMEFPEDEQLRMNDPSSWQYKELRMSPYLTITASDMRRWLSVRCVVDDNKKFPVQDQDLNDTVTVNTGPSAEHSRTLLSFNYIARDPDTRKLKLMGGLFDLNQHYFKRQVARVVEDRTVAKQCPFVSFFSETLCADLTNITVNDVLLDPFFLERFVSNVSDEPQMFYPSSYGCRRVYVATKDKIMICALDSLPAQVVARVAADLPKFLVERHSASVGLTAIGLQTEIDHSQPLERQQLATVLSAVVYHGHITEVSLGVSENTFSAETCQTIDDWMWTEMQKQWNKMNEIMTPFFNGTAKGLSDAHVRELSACDILFRGARAFYGAMVKRVSAVFDNTSILELRSTTALLFGQSLFVQNYLRTRRLLPVDDDVRAVNREIRSDMNRRRQNAKKRGCELYIDMMLQNLYKYCGNESFWLTRTPKDLYPPTLMDLVSILPLSDVPARLKRALLLYYLLDYAHFCPSMTHSDRDSSVGNNLSNCDRIVTQIGAGIKLTQEEAEIVLGQWSKDFNDEVENAHPEVVSNNAVKEAKTELSRLASQPVIKFSEEDECRFKELLSFVYPREISAVYWNCLLIKQNRLKEVETELDVPENMDEKQAKLYLEAAAQIRQLRVNNPGLYDKIDQQHSLSQEILERYKQRETNDDLIVSPHRSVVFKNTNGNINKRRQSMIAPRKRLSLNTTLPVVDESMHVLTPEPQKKTMLDFDDDDTPQRICKDVSPTALDEIRNLVRTPKARAKAAAAAEGRFDLSMDTTPEQTRKLPPPTSILKSAAKNVLTPSRGGIRWDPAFCTPEESIEASTHTANPISAPNFDSDGDDDDEQLISRLKASSSHNVVQNEDDDDMRGEESSRIVGDEVNDTIGICDESQEMEGIEALAEESSTDAPNEIIETSFEEQDEGDVIDHDQQLDNKDNEIIGEKEMEEHAKEDLVLREVEEQADEDLVNKVMEEQTEEDLVLKMVEEQTEEDLILKEMEEQSDEELILNEMEEESEESVILKEVEEQTKEDTIFKAVEEQAEEDYLSKEVEEKDEVNVVQKVAEENTQDLVRMDIQEDLNKEVEEQSGENFIGQHNEDILIESPSGARPLVDYSFSDSTICSTPPRYKASPSANVTAAHTDEHILMRSFEEQDASDVAEECQETETIAQIEEEPLTADQISEEKANESINAVQEHHLVPDLLCNETFTIPEKEVEGGTFVVENLNEKDFAVKMTDNEIQETTSPTVCQQQVTPSQDNTEESSEINENLSKSEDDYEQQKVSEVSENGQKDQDLLVDDVFMEQDEDKSEENENSETNDMEPHVQTTAVDHNTVVIEETIVDDSNNLIENEEQENIEKNIELQEMTTVVTRVIEEVSFVVERVENNKKVVEQKVERNIEVFSVSPKKPAADEPCSPARKEPEPIKPSSGLRRSSRARSISTRADSEPPAVRTRRTPSRANKEKSVIPEEKEEEEEKEVLPKRGRRAASTLSTTSTTSSTTTRSTRGRGKNLFAAELAEMDSKFGSGYKPVTTKASLPPIAPRKSKTSSPEDEEASSTSRRRSVSRTRSTGSSKNVEEEKPTTAKRTTRRSSSRSRAAASPEPESKEIEAQLDFPTPTPKSPKRTTRRSSSRSRPAASPEAKETDAQLDFPTPTPKSPARKSVLVDNEPTNSIQPKSPARGRGRPRKNVENVNTTVVIEPSTPTRQSRKGSESSEEILMEQPKSSRKRSVSNSSEPSATRSSVKRSNKSVLSSIAETKQTAEEEVNTPSKRARRSAAR